MNIEILTKAASKTYIFLLHYPVLNKDGEIITTAVTNLDIHDISRASRTYGLGGYFLITPIRLQQELINKVISHWQKGYGSTHNPRRKEAFKNTKVFASLKEGIQEVEGIHKQKPLLMATSAKPYDGVTYYNYADIPKLKPPVILLLGTGWGLIPEIIKQCDGLLPPIKGPVSYNHLSVRSAASIILDRIFGL